MAAIPLTGQLGTAALGALELGAPIIWAVYVPHRYRAQSALSADTGISGITRNLTPHSALSANIMGSSISRDRTPHSTVSATTAESGVE